MAHIYGLGAMNEEQREKFLAIQCPTGYNRITDSFMEDFAAGDEGTPYITPAEMCMSPWGTYLKNAGSQFDETLKARYQRGKAIAPAMEFAQSLYAAGHGEFGPLVSSPLSLIVLGGIALWILTRK